MSFLRSVRAPEFEGDRFRLHVERQTFDTRGRYGKSWLTIAPSDDAVGLDDERQFYLPLDQSEALVEACAAFNEIMNRHEAVTAVAKPVRRKRREVIAC